MFCAHKCCMYVLLILYCHGNIFAIVMLDFIFLLTQFSVTDECYWITHTTAYCGDCIISLPDYCFCLNHRKDVSLILQYTANDRIVYENKVFNLTTVRSYKLFQFLCMN